MQEVFTISGFDSILPIYNGPGNRQPLPLYAGKGAAPLVDEILIITCFTPIVCLTPISSMAFADRAVREKIRSAGL